MVLICNICFGKSSCGSLSDQYLTEVCLCIFQVLLLHEKFFLMYLLYQMEVLMTAPRIEQVRTVQTRVTFGENFQVSVGIKPIICFVCDRWDQILRVPFLYQLFFSYVFF